MHGMHVCVCVCMCVCVHPQEHKYISWDCIVVVAKLSLVD